MGRDGMRDTLGRDVGGLVYENDKILDLVLLIRCSGILVVPEDLEIIRSKVKINRKAIQLIESSSPMNYMATGTISATYR